MIPGTVRPRNSPRTSHSFFCLWRESAMALSLFVSLSLRPHMFLNNGTRHDDNHMVHIDTVLGAWLSLEIRKEFRLITKMLLKVNGQRWSPCCLCDRLAWVVNSCWPWARSVFEMSLREESFDYSIGNLLVHEVCQSYELAFNKYKSNVWARRTPSYVNFV